jgi:ADP-ribosylglycohydrolase
MRELFSLISSGTTAVWAAERLTAPDDPEQAIRIAIEIGGDTDTIAAMTACAPCPPTGSPA